MAMRRCANATPADDMLAPLPVSDAGLRATQDREPVEPLARDLTAALHSCLVDDVTK